jgi:hypothetical protein
VLRGVDRSTAPQASLTDFRQVGAALLVTDPAEQLCAGASRIGVPLVADFTNTDTPQPELARLLRRRGRWPAVMCFVFGSDDARAPHLKPEARNVLFAALCRERDSSTGPSPAAKWADAVVFEAATATALNRLAANCAKPAIALRRLGRTMDAGSARSQCDRLQADLAAEARGRREWAGYIV